MTQNTQLRFQLWGWILFILSAIFFMAASIRAQDPISLIGGALFLVACLVFLAPLLVQRTAAADEQAASPYISPISYCVRRTGAVSHRTPVGPLNVV